MILSPFIRNPYNYDVDDASCEAGLMCDDDSLTVQDALDDSDINTIVRRFMLTGELPHDIRPPVYGDFTGIGTYQEALEAVRMAEEAFMQLPAEVRNKFDNDPELFVGFCSDPSNLAEMKSMGLLAPSSPTSSGSEAPQAPTLPPVVPAASGA